MRQVNMDGWEEVMRTSVIRVNGYGTGGERE